MELISKFREVCVAVYNNSWEDVIEVDNKDIRVRVVTDNCDDIVAVDYENGRVYRLTDDYSIKEIGIGNKTDGKFVIPFGYDWDENGRKKIYYVRKSQIICLVAHMDEFFEILENNDTGFCRYGMPVACHIDGNVLNNRADNLEWGTNGDNVRQGRLVQSFQYRFPGIITNPIIREFDKSKGYKGKDVVIPYIEGGIRNKWIKEFEEEVYKLKLGNTAKDEKYCSMDTLKVFYDFMVRKGYWNRNQELENKYELDKNKA